LRLGTGVLRLGGAAAGHVRPAIAAVCQRVCSYPSKVGRNQPAGRLRHWGSGATHASMRGNSHGRWRHGGQGHSGTVGDGRHTGLKGAGVAALYCVSLLLFRVSTTWSTAGASSVTSKLRSSSRRKTWTCTVSPGCHIDSTRFIDVVSVTRSPSMATKVSPADSPARCAAPFS